MPTSMVLKATLMILGKVEDLLVDIGLMLKRERLYRNLSQKVVSMRSGISESALKNLEGGKGASLTTFIQVCRTLGKDEWIMRLGPPDAVSVKDYAKRGSRPRLRASATKILWGQTPRSADFSSHLRLPPHHNHEKCVVRK